MKIWIDDIRNAPDDEWIVCRTVQSAIKVLHQFGSDITDISFDHDISHQVTVGKSSRPYPCDETFQSVAHYLGLLSQSAEGVPELASVTIHSANPTGAKEIAAILADYGMMAEIAPLAQVNRLEATLS